jgi:hypothetical protein
MESKELRPLKQALLDAYGHFADKRIRDIDRGDLFIIDDRGPGDLGADRKLFSWFCSIFAQVISSDVVKVSLRGGVPHSTAVAHWIDKYQGIKSEGRLEFNVRAHDVAKLKDLAGAFRSIIRPGVRYPVRSYKYVCPRAAASLDRFYETLTGHWHS